MMKFRPSSNGTMATTRCPQCGTRFISDATVITRHMKHSHKLELSPEDVAELIARPRPPAPRSSTASVKPSVAKSASKKRKVLRSPSGDVIDADLEHELRWRRIILAGSPGLGRRC